ncbi:MAG: hypothetical protein ACI8RN_002574 [Glaciecola sp.]|jgi:hypothetical protein
MSRSEYNGIKKRSTQTGFSRQRKLAAKRAKAGVVARFALAQ